MALEEYSVNYSTGRKKLQEVIDRFTGGWQINEIVLKMVLNSLHSNKPHTLKASTTTTLRKKTTENILEKGENPDNQNFLHFQESFKQISSF